jgi:hypothetical protein
VLLSSRNPGAGNAAGGVTAYRPSNPQGNVVVVSSPYCTDPLAIAIVYTLPLLGHRTKRRQCVAQFFWSYPTIFAKTVIESLKSLGTPIVVLVQQTSDNPAGAPNQLTSSVSEFLTFPKSVSPVTQTLQYIGGAKMRKQLQ